MKKLGGFFAVTFMSTTPSLAVGSSSAIRFQEAPAPPTSLAFRRTGGRVAMLSKSFELISSSFAARGNETTHPSNSDKQSQWSTVEQNRMPLS